MGISSSKSAERESRPQGETSRSRGLAAYLRVSTDRQAEHGQGLDIQRATIRHWAEENGHQIVLWTHDAGISGSNGLDDREGLFDAISAVQDGTAEGIVVYKLDRLARDFVLQETLLAMVWKAGGRIYSCSSGEDGFLDPDGSTEDPSRTMVRQILGVIAEYERSMIRLRMRAGKLAKRARGGYLGGRVPFGYELDADGSLVESEREQAALKRMTELRSGGKSLQAICDILTAEGFPTKHGGKWQSATVGQLLKRQSARS